MTGRVAAAAALLLLVAPSALAEMTVRTAFSRRQILPMEEVSFTVTIQGERLPRAPAVPEPDFSDFDVLEGPMRQRSSQVSIVNGQVSQSEVLTYTWVVVPKKEGQLSVPAIVVQADGLKIVSGTALLSVTQGAGAGPSVQTQPQTGTPATNPRERARAEPNRALEDPRQRGQVLDMRAEVDESEAWVGQEIVLDHVLDYASDVDSFSLRSPPEFPGFSNVPREVHAQGSPVRDPQTGATTHFSAPLSRWALVPLSAGDKQIPSQAYALTVPGRDSFPFGFPFRSEQVVRSTQPLTIKVNPLPPGAPESFAGAVGAYQVEAALDSTSVKAGDGVNLTVTISGRGNLHAVAAPQLAVPQGLRAFDPEVEEKAGVTSDGHTEGKRIFKFPLLVSEPGRHEIPPIAWTFFDPRAARYVTRTTPALALEAAEGESVPAPIQAGPIAPTTARVDIQGADIRHVRPTLSAHRPDVGAGGWPTWLIAALAGGPLLNVVLGALSLARLAMTRDPAELRAQGAARRARQRLREARVALAAGKTLDAADSIARAVAGLVADRLRMGAELSPAEARGALEQAGHEELGRDAEALLMECDFARFASTSAGVDLAALLRRGEALVAPLARVRPRAKAA
jgi:hypothetical protein